MSKYFVIYKPVGMLSQFSSDGEKEVLGSLHDFDKDIYPVGRLDSDSEGLLILTNDKSLNDKLLNPKNKHKKTYYVQIEGDITNEALSKIQKPLTIKLKKGKTHKTLPCKASIIEEPVLPERTPPIRFRKNKPTSWISITLEEGKNRQVRKMTAAVGFPTLRLVRYSIEDVNISGFEVKEVREFEREVLFKELGF